MLKNNLKSALRDFLKHKTFSLINILGLTVGLTATMLIGLYVSHEHSYDEFHKDADNIYRFTREFKGQDGTLSLHFSNIASPFGPLLQAEFEPQIESLGRFMTTEASIRSDRSVFIESNFGFADPEILGVLSFHTTQGVLKDALTQPNAVAITESMSQKYFGKDNPIGRILKYNDERELIVKAVFQDFPANSTIQFDMLTDMTLVKESLAEEGGMNRAWDNNILRTMFKLRQGKKITEIESGLSSFMIKHLGEDALDWNELHIQKLTDVHLRSSLSDEGGQNGSLAEVRIFTLLAILIMVIATANYVNLSTGRLISRAKSVGVRKVLGADKYNLIKQYLTESILMLMFAIAFASVVTALLMPLFTKLTGLTLEFSIVEYGKLIAWLVVSALFMGLLAGIYPALYLSALSPVKALKKTLNKGQGHGSGLRRVLVIFQFTISAVLIVTSVVVYQQLNYLNNKSLGYDKEQIVVLKLSNDVNTQYKTFKNEILKIPGITSAGGSSRIPSGELLDSNRAYVERDGEMTALNTEIVIKKIAVDPDFVSTYKMNLKAGRNFDIERPADSRTFVMNERSVQVIGWSSAEEAIGQTMIYDNVRGTVIGVLEDFHFESLQKEIAPLILMNSPDRARHLSVKMDFSNASAILPAMEKVYDRFSPNDPIDYNFLDERFKALYESETRRSQLFTIFSSMAILLACLGLFGLALFTVLHRSKEMSIRIVLGASTSHIVKILSGEYTRLILVSVLLAFPLAWLFTADWLEGYANRIQVSWIPYVLATIIIVMISFVAIGSLIFNAARSNPVDRLRDE